MSRSSAHRAPGSTPVHWDIPPDVMTVLRDRANGADRPLGVQVVRDLRWAYGITETGQWDAPLPCMAGPQLGAGPLAQATSQVVTSPASGTSSNPLPEPAEQPSAVKPAPQQSWADSYKHRLEQQAAAPASTMPDAGLPSEVPDEPLSPELQALLDRPPPEQPDPYAGLTYDQLPADAPQEVKARVMRAQIELDPANPLSHADPDSKLYLAQAKRNMRDWHERHGKMLPERTSFGDATISDDNIRPDWQRPPPGTTVHPAR